MCGIYGSTKLYTEEIVKKKLERTNFRGPDYTGIERIDDKVILGHNRLAIIDLDSRSNQPFNYYEKLCVVFNGEIYNFNNIKEDLIASGYAFYTKSDTEVICAAYLEWGYKCVEKFIGMFAFVIYDKSKEILFGARDRIGKKPLYYTLNNNNFEFSSQLSSISIGNHFSIREESVSQFLNWSNIPDPYTIYKEVEKVKAGHYFIYNLNDKKFFYDKYWDIGFEKIDSTITYNNAKQKLKDLIVDATTKRMIADVPLGVFLSGGIDSSLIAAIAQKNSSTPIKTFSIKFAYDNFDESIYAERIAKYIGSDHKTILCDANEAINMIENYYQYFDEPFGDSSAIPCMLLAKHTREHVTVALSGDGGDEGFLGYTRYSWINQFNLIKKVPFVIKFLLGQFLVKINHRRLKAIGEALRISKVEEIYKSILSYRKIKFLLNPQKAVYADFDNFLYSDKNLLERVSDYDIKAYLNNDINTKVDRACMAFSLECRSPLMDHRVIEFSRIIPTKYKFFKGIKKKILKDILSDYIPPHLFERPKAGFGAPISNWFRTQLQSYVFENLTDRNLQMIPNLNVEYTKRAIQNHMSEKEDNSVLIWNLLVLVQWTNFNKNIN